MDNRLQRSRKATLALGAAMVTFLCLPCAQSSAPQDTDRQAAQSQDRQASQGDQDRQQDQGQDRQQDQRTDDRRNVASFDQFLDGHREIADQVRKDPSLLDNRNFLQSHPALQTYLQDNPGVRDQLRQDPRAFMRQEDAYDRDTNLRDRNAGIQDRDAGMRDRTADGRELANFDQFLDSHREIGEQVRKDPSLLDNRSFVQNHPALQTYLQDNPGVRDQLRQDPKAFMRQEDAYDRNSNARDRDPMHDHMADFGGFLHNHADIQKDLSRNPSVVKDHDYMENHAELNTYLNAHPDVRADLMANPQSFVRGAQQYRNASTPSGAGVNTGAGAGVKSGTDPEGTGAAGSGASSGTSTNPAPPTHSPTKPNQ